MSGLQSALAVVLGYVVMAVAVIVFYALLSGGPTVPPPFDLVLHLVAGLFAAVAGGYVTGLVAGRAEHRHARMLAVVIVVIWLLGMLFWQGAQQEPLAIQIGNVVVGVIGVIAGGSIRARHAARR